MNLRSKTPHVFGACALLLLAATAASAADPEPDLHNGRPPTLSEDLREAEQSMRDTLAEAETLLTPEDYAQIKKIHDYWAASEAATNVRAYMDSGLSESEAWAMEIGGHADAVSQAVDVLQLRREGKGVEGVYEFGPNSGKSYQGMLLVRQMDDSYTVSVNVAKGSGAAASTCSFVGGGNLRGAVLNVNNEEDPDIALTITFEGPSARVEASGAANAECGHGMALDGVYVK